MIALGTDSGPILAPFWDPKSAHICPKRVPRSIKKVIEKLVEFGIDFLTIFGPFWLPTWGAQGVQRIRVSGSSRLPEPPWGPNGPQDSSKKDFCPKIVRIYWPCHQNSRNTCVLPQYLQVMKNDNLQKMKYKAPIIRVSLAGPIDSHHFSMKIWISPDTQKSLHI